MFDNINQLILASQDIYLLSIESLYEFHAEKVPCFNVIPIAKKVCYNVDP